MRARHVVCACAGSGSEIAGSSNSEVTFGSVVGGGTGSPPSFVRTSDLPVVGPRVVGGGAGASNRLGGAGTGGAAAFDPKVIDI